MKWLLAICYLHYVSSTLYFFIYSYFYTYSVVLSFFFMYAFVLFNKEINHARESNFILMSFLNGDIVEIGLHFWRFVEFIRF